MTNTENIKKIESTKNVVRKEQNKFASFEDFFPKAIMQDVIKFVYICTQKI